MRQNHKRIYLYTKLTQAKLFWKILNEMLEFFTVSPQHKNVNVANFVLALPLKINQTNVAFNLKM